MTVRIAGVWELGWNTPIKEMDLWEFSLKEFSVDQFTMAPVTGIFNSYVDEVADIETYIAERRAAGDAVVFCDENAETSLPEFTHPVNALYVFGKSGLSAYTAYAQPGDLGVKIPTNSNQGGFWPHQAAAIILYDRYLKSLP